MQSLKGWYCLFMPQSQGYLSLGLLFDNLIVHGGLIIEVEIDSKLGLNGIQCFASGIQTERCFIMSYVNDVAYTCIQAFIDEARQTTQVAITRVREMQCVS